ncbi:MAG TPA: phosphoenolpyruvate--protein phosphotransferase [Kineosporiaceae bacterium]|nr:phosphoenolpyruvate--protein phosphotransferase [Kineosporiaceae bacterium]
MVSHSRALARAAVALAEQMLQDQQVRMVIAAGLDEETFGTDAMQIHDALVEADQDGDGVVVLMDLGSAVLSAELALELLADDAARARVLLCPAPLVEGLVVAAVTALSGADGPKVAAEAVASLAGKQSQLATPAEASPESTFPPAETRPADVNAGRFRVTPVHGLHARPAARLVQVLQSLDARVELRNLSTGSGWVPGASLSRLATLGALPDHEVEVRASGPQAPQALEQVLALAQRNFDDPPSADQPQPDADTSSDLLSERVRGPFPASPGIGFGPARPAPGLIRPAPGSTRPELELARPELELARPEPGKIAAPSEKSEIVEDPAEGRRRLDAAVDAVRAQVQEIRQRVAHEVNEAEAAIFDTHLALLADPELLEAARSRIAVGQAASSAWANAVSVAAAGYESLTDPYLQARSADVRALGNQVSRHLLGAYDRSEELGERSGVLIAADLTPAEAATLNPARVTAVVLAFGSPTAHSAILIRARGIPAVVGAGAAVLEIADGTPLAVDGTTGELVIEPAEAVAAELRERAAAAQARNRQALTRADAPATTRDGVRILVGANISSIEDARDATASGADLIGLVRTEFLFLGRSQAPDIAEQESIYRALAETAAGRRITFRTLDVGGDKPLAYLPQRVEANPFLGVRGVRFALQQPELLADQLLAMVRVAHDLPISVMFPMVSTLDELIRARRSLDEAIKLTGRGTPSEFQIGIMVEVPAAALKAATFARHVDFLSIGTNDLTQYTLAAERGNDAVEPLADPFDPAVLRLIEITCRGAGPNVTVAVCGELAADERATEVLIGLGVRELSVTPHAIPAVKQAVRALALPDASTLAARTLVAPSADAVRSLLRPLAESPPNAPS